MEGKKQMGSSSSSSSFTSDLFGSKESSVSSSSGIFGSIFAPSSKVYGKESVRAETVVKKQDSESELWSTKPGPQDTITQGSEGESFPNKDMSHFYQEQRVQPCHLSSSIYYGGQDIYSHPQNTQASSGSIKMGEKMIRAVLQEEIGGKLISTGIRVVNETASIYMS
ncbi:hypothetical protein HYC85_006565 [Camellia sinensis]|uniref:Uncharacterized protein n=1 Tax=Camellia sinensis TaxID=4442 RepID=A0A7J7HLV0_CAMSI|nr:hypothetical protein HYC85_006565 [Camellia sinensis]